LKSEHLTI